jgi:hypothetical protein
MRQRARSTPPPTIRRLSKEAAKQALLGMAVVSQRPILVGVAAVRLGISWTLDETAALFAELVDEKQLRPISPEEREYYGLQEGYVLVGVNSRK